MKFCILCIALFCSVALISAAISEDFKIYDIQTQNEFEKEVLLRLQTVEDYDFFSLSRALSAPTRVLVRAQNTTDFEQILERFGLNYAVLDETENQSPIVLGRAASSSVSSYISFSSFQRFAAINNYLDVLASKFAQRVSVQVIGKSYEGRDLKTITITNGDGVSGKNVILVDAGIHAREWIAPASALYIIYELVENYKNNAELLQNYDWVILPVINPDGYEYTHTNSRMWRKTRKPVKSYCIGTDANRNFAHNWGVVGASSYCSSDTYKGPTAFSEPETQALRDLMHELSDRAKFYLSLHSYGNYLLYPWGYSSALPDNWRDIDEVAQAGAAAIKAATGTKYTVGSSTNVLYAAAGGSDDYALGEVGIPISITMELPAGGSGFNPSTSQLLPFVQESWVGISVMAKKVMEKY